MIRLEHITKIFRDGTTSKTALDDVSLCFDDTGLVVIMGPSGCGKTTLLNIIGLLDEASSGIYSLDGVDTKRFGNVDRERHRRETFACLFQHYFLLDGFSAYENARLAETFVPGQNQSNTETLHQRFADFGLGGIMNQPSETLSGGEAQRTGLIRALVKDTPIIIADEPTGALDQTNGNTLMNRLKVEATRRLIIVVTHDQEVAKRHADRLIILQDGKIVNDQTINKTSPLMASHIRKSLSQSNVTLINRRFYQLSRRRLRFAFLSLLIGLVTGLLTLGLHHGGPILASRHPLQYPDYNVFYLRKRETIPIENTPMNLVRYERPKWDELSNTGIDLSRAYIDVSLRGIFNGGSYVSIDGVRLSNMEFRPLMGQDFPFPSQDRFDYVYVNHAAYEKMSAFVENGNLPRLEFTTGLTTSFRHEQVVVDTLECHRELTIIDVIESNAVMQSPILYYSHVGARRWLENIEVINLSIQMGYSVSWYERISMGMNGDTITNFELLIAFPDSDSVLERYPKMLENNDFSWDSSYHQDRALLSSVVTAIDYGLLFFVTIGAVSSVLTLALSLSRVYVEQRRRLAILWELGYPLRTLKNTILAMGRRMAITAIAVAFALIPALTWLVNEVIEKRYGLSRIIQIPWFEYQGVALAVPVGILILVLSIVEATTRILVSSLKTKVLIQELADDD